MSNATDNRNVLVVVTSEDCGACKALKTNGTYDKIIKDAQISGIVRVVEIVKKKMGDTIEPPYPTQLNKIAIWYPTFILINGKAWNEKFSNSKNSDLPIEIFNGVFKDGIASFSENRIGMDKVLTWATSHIDTNLKFSVSTNTIPQIVNKFGIAEPEERKINGDTKKIYIPTCGTVMKYKRSSKR